MRHPALAGSGVGVGLGVALGPADGDGPAAPLHAADLAMYADESSRSEPAG